MGEEAARTRPAEGEAGPSRRPGPPPSMSPADVARRAELNRYLPPGVFPADRRRLLARLRQGHAPDSVVEAVSALPDGREFHGVGEIMRVIVRGGPH